MALRHDVAPLQKSVFSLYLLLILTLGKPSYYPWSPAKNEVLGVKEKKSNSNTQTLGINDLLDTISTILHLGDGKNQERGRGKKNT